MLNFFKVILIRLGNVFSVVHYTVDLLGNTLALNTIVALAIAPFPMTNLFCLLLEFKKCFGLDSLPYIGKCVPDSSSLTLELFLFLCFLG